MLKPAAAFTDEEVETKSKRPALSWLPPSSDKATTSISGFVFPDLKAVANLPVSEKRAIIKQIIERIPTSREELFAYPIDWKAVDSVIHLGCLLFGCAQTISGLKDTLWVYRNS